MLTLLFQNDFNALYPEIFLSIIICLILIFGLYFNTSLKYNKTHVITHVTSITIQALIITSFLILNNPIKQSLLLNNLLILDEFTTTVKLITCITTICCLLLTFQYSKNMKLYNFEFAILILIALLGIFFIASAFNLLALYLAIELQSLTLYILAALKRNTKFSTEAGLKYFILGAVASGFLLIGCSMLYGFTGLIGFNDLMKLFGNLNDLYDRPAFEGILLGLIFIIIAILFKIAAVPFHMWAPDVYEGAPTIVTAFFAIVPKIALFSLLIRLLSQTFYNFIEYWQDLIMISVVATLFFATFATLEQKKIKRFLAYSTIGHTGYILLGILSGTPSGLQAAFLYLIIYILMSIGFFSIILSLYNNITKKNIKYLTEFHNIGYTNPLIALSLTIIVFSMAGIPPLAGFISKLYIFISAIDAGFYLITLIAILMSAISAVYYIKFVKILYFEKTYTFTTYQNMDFFKAFLITISVFFIIGFFFNPAPLLILTHKCTLLLCF